METGNRVSAKVLCTSGFAFPMDSFLCQQLEALMYCDNGFNKTVCVTTLSV